MRPSVLLIEGGRRMEVISRESTQRKSGFPIHFPMNRLDMHMWMD